MAAKTWQFSIDCDGPAKKTLEGMKTFHLEWGGLVDVIVVANAPLFAIFEGNKFP